MRNFSIKISDTQRVLLMACLDQVVAASDDEKAAELHTALDNLEYDDTCWDLTQWEGA